MAKRFIDTGIFDDEWFMDLSKDGKIVWLYFITKCDHAGLLHINLKLATVQTGIKDILTVIKELSNRIVRVNEQLFFIPKFIDFQYPDFPKSKVKQQASAIDLLVKYGILNKETLTLNKELTNSYGNGNDNGNDNEKGVVGGKLETGELEVKTWRNDFDVYKSELFSVYNSLLLDRKYLDERQRFHPTLDIPLSIEKSVTEFWATERGWKHKKDGKAHNLDWKSTLTKALDLSSNQVKKQYPPQPQTGRMP